MNALILNRQSKLPEDGWHQFEVPGEHVNHDSKVVQVIDEKAVTSILNRFNQEREASGDNFGGLLVDKDHFSLDAEQTSEAMGWAMELRNRAGVPEAKVSWTAVGRPLIESKPDQPPAYKYFSTVYDGTDCEVIGNRQIGGKPYKVVRPLRLDRLALTNDPNNKGGKPISNRQTAATADRTEKPNASTMKSVLKLLGLAEDASEESAVAAVQKITNRAGLVDALTTERDTLLTAQVESDLDKYKAVIKNRDAFKKQLLANRTSTLELLEGLQTAAPVEQKDRVTNRSTAKTPAEVEADKAKAKGAEALGQKIQNRAHAIQKEKSKGSRTYPWTNAFNEASAELSSDAK